eukprot:CFRG2668T1
MDDNKVVEIDSDGNVVGYSSVVDDLVNGDARRKEEKLRRRKKEKNPVDTSGKSNVDKEDKEPGKGKYYFFLILMLGGPLLPLLLSGWELFINSQFAMQIGLVATPRDRIISYYEQWNPERLQQKGFVDRTERKWRGKYDKLFKILDKKYKNLQRDNDEDADN